MKNEDRQLITKAYDALECLNNLRMTSYRDRLFQICRQEEIEHRGSRGPFNASVNDCARMFVVRWIAGYLTGTDKKPKVKDYLSLKKSCFFAAALVLNYRKEIRQALRKFDTKQLAAFDYCEVIE